MRRASVRFLHLIIPASMITVLLSCSTVPSSGTQETDRLPGENTDVHDEDAADEFTYEELTFGPGEGGLQPPPSGERGFADPSSHPGAAFRIEISPDSYQVRQMRYGNRIYCIRNSAREAVIRRMVARYGHVNARRAGHVIVTVYPTGGRLIKYRFVRSTFVRELDSIIMKDLSTIHFKVVKGRAPSAIYITYVITVLRSQEPSASP